MERCQKMRYENNCMILMSSHDQPYLVSNHCWRYDTYIQRYLKCFMFDLKVHFGFKLDFFILDLLHHMYSFSADSNGLLLICLHILRMILCKFQIKFIDFLVHFSCISYALLMHFLCTSYALLMHFFKSA